jgi:hypothetical protein
MSAVKHERQKLHSAMWPHRVTWLFRGDVVCHTRQWLGMARWSYGVTPFVAQEVVVVLGN